MSQFFFFFFFFFSLIFGFFLFSDKLVELVGGGSVINRAYPVRENMGHHKINKLISRLFRFVGIQGSNMLQDYKESYIMTINWNKDSPATPCPPRPVLHPHAPPGDAVDA